MSICLLDTNVLMALAWPNHVHHETAHQWFSRHARNGWATCPITQCGFVRISSNPRISNGSVTPGNAQTILRGMTSHKQHTFWPADIDYAHEGKHLGSILTGHQQVTDSYLLYLAIKHRGRLATFDKGIVSLVPPGRTVRECFELLVVT